MAHQDDMNWLRKEKLIVRLQGKEFILYAGLLALAHKHGLKSIRTEMLVESDDFAMAKATVEGKDSGPFEDYGDASTKNVGRMIVPHLRRMAVTRAKARALRDFTAIGLCSLEELGSNTEEAKPAPAPKRKPRAKKAAPKAEEPPAPSTEAMVETEPAGKNGKHPSWMAAHTGFILRVEEMGWKYEEVAAMCERDGHKRPSQMTDKERTIVMNYLEDKLLKKWEEA